MKKKRWITEMSNKTKLELTWIGKENRPRLEPRILLEDPEKSYHARHRVTADDIFGNRLMRAKKGGNPCGSPHRNCD